MTGIEKPGIGLIWAQTQEGGVIGKAGGMPWHVPEDMKHFAATTTGHPIVMGRRTWESIPERFRPFTGRTNIIVTRQAGWEAAGTVSAHSLDEALAVAAQSEGGERVWVIGGGEIFDEALPLADLAVVTILDLDVDGDTFAPHLDSSWRLASVRPDDGGWHTSRTGVPYRIVEFRRGQA
ncbi:dihydrofolate reductase [Sinomonas notoginsengisoli]|uniref:dihydrofolate reductase n=1 Tax=Sinomonas notoginsengisoli TaxID=1457311 RepID=UPI001F35061A|nr:dihydrofolate reductase [Sinomonas notoginsengisoli]